ncbi:MAG: glycosyltransferase family 4 protein [Patescibacteria group bacterium]|nr:glycosyltransferase family 4 protein [Patescibacteria group bacterium]
MKTSVWMPANLDACALYRMFLPHFYLAGSRFLPLQAKQHTSSEISAFDVVVVQRQCLPDNIKALELFKQMGMRIVFDLDDDLWSLPATNPAQKIFRALREGLAEALRYADLLTVSTSFLATAARTALPSLRCDIAVIENAISSDVFSDRHCWDDDNEDVVIGWGGSNSHGGDIGVAFEVLKELLECEPRVRLEFVGMRPPASILKHPRVRIRPWVPIAQYAATLSTWAWDVMLAPLDSTRFNFSKSSIKQLEAALTGAVCLASPLPNYVSFCGDDEMLKWTLCDTRKHWLEKMRALIADKAMRRELVRRARASVATGYDMAARAEVWRAAVNG